MKQFPPPSVRRVWMLTAVWTAAVLGFASGSKVLAQAGSTNLVSGLLAVPGERDVFTFSLADRGRFYFDALANVSTLNWSLEGPTGLMVDDRAFTSSDAGNGSVLSLVAGFYQLTVDGDGASTNAYQFRFVNLAAAGLLTPGTVVSNALSPGNETDLFQFTSAAGDRLLFDRLTAPAAGNIWWRLVDPYGNEVFSTPFNDVNNVTQRVAGAYTLLVEGYPGNVSSAAYSFSVVPQGNTPPAPFGGVPMALDSVIVGSLTNASTNSFVFSLGGETRMIFDQLTNRTTMQWFLEGPPGLIVNGAALHASDGLNGVPVLNLSPGQYQVRVRRTSAGIDPYRFRVLNAGNAAPVTPGTPILGTLAPGSATDIYRFNAAAGARYYFDVHSTNGSGSAEWRLFDPFDKLVAAAGLRTDRGPLTVTTSGAYTLLVEGFWNDVPPGPYRFDIVPVLDAVQALTLGSLTSGRIDAPGQTRQYLFTLGAPTRLHFDGRTSNSPLRWTLAGATGVIVANRVMSAVEYNLELPTLAAGDYTLTVSGSGDDTGEFAFRLFDLADAMPIALGLPNSSTLAPANEAEAYRFDAMAGTSVYFDLLTHAGAPNAYWRCFDPQGNAVFGSFLADHGPVTLTSSGRYTIVVDGYPSDTLSGSYTFSVRPVVDGIQPLVLNTLTSGAIAVPGQVQVHRFTLPGAATLYFDARTNAPLRWSLTGPTGVIVINRGFASAEYSQEPLHLAGGDYTLTVDGVGDVTGEFSFVLRDLALATPVVPGIPLNAILDPGDETDVYRFTGSAGSRVYFDFISKTGLVSAHWRCFDPLGNPVFGAFLSDVGPLTLPMSGLYTLLVEGYPGDTASGSYSVNVRPVADSVEPLVLGAVVEGQIDEPGQARHYTFTLTTAERLCFDSQANAALRWLLRGPDGIEVNQRTFSSPDYSLAPLALNPGDYRLTITGNADDTGSFRFRLFALDGAVAIAPGTVVGGTLEPGNETDAYQFNAAAPATDSSSIGSVARASRAPIGGSLIPGGSPSSAATLALTPAPTGS